MTNPNFVLFCPPWEIERRIRLFFVIGEVELICGTMTIWCRSVTGNSISDHLVYFGIELMGETWRSCRIVMNPNIEKYGRTDLNGNFIFSKDPAILKLNSHSNVVSNLV